MVEFRPVDIHDDRDFIIEMHFVRAFEAEPASERRQGLAVFREKAEKMDRAGRELKAIKSSLKDGRTIAEIIVVDGVDAGFVWATFGEMPGDYSVYTELRSLAFKLNFQRRGLGRMTLRHVEEVAAENGAECVRSTGSVPSDAVRQFHESMGFNPVQIVFEKRLPVRTM